MGLRLGLGLGAGGGRSLLDSDALSYFTRAGIASGTVSIPQYSNKNLLSDSTFALNAWSQYGANLVSQSAIVDPFGNTNTVYKIVETAATTAHRTEKSITSLVPSGTTVRFSVYLKAVERTTVLLSDGASSGSVTFNLTNGTVSSSTGTGLGIIVTDVGNGWYRCSYTYTTSNATVYPNISPAVGGTNNYTGDGVSGFYVYGPQVELGSSTTSYVPTTTNQALGISGTLTVNPRQQLITFIKGLKDLGIWNNSICWPLRSSQNAGTGTTAYSLGGLGIYNGTLTNGPTWGVAGVQSGGAAGNNSARIVISTNLKQFINVGATIFGCLSNSGDDNYTMFQLADSDDGNPTYPTLLVNQTSVTGVVPSCTRNGIRTFFPTNRGGAFPSGFSTVAGVYRATSQANFRNGVLIANETGLDLINPDSQVTANIATIASRGNGPITGGGSICPISFITSQPLTDSQVTSLNSLYKSTLGVGLNLP